MFNPARGCRCHGWLEGSVSHLGYSGVMEHLCLALSGALWGSYRPPPTDMLGDEILFRS